MATHHLGSPPPYETPAESSTASSSFLSSFKQSLSSFTVSPSRIDVEVLPFDSVDMYGQPDKDSAYSLSGQVAVTLLPPMGLFGDTPTADEHILLLDSLVLTFSGQSELVTPQTGYAACRVHTSTHELLSGPLELRHTWAAGAPRAPARWFVVFNIPVPGWLPASTYTRFGSGHSEPETSYRLAATARYRDARPAARAPWREYVGLAATPTTSSQSAPCAVRVHRYALPPPPGPRAGDELQGTPFRAAEFAGVVEGTDSDIPMDVLSGLRMRAYVPEHVPLDAESFPLLVKVRPEGLDAETRRRLRLPGFSLSVTQTETVRSSLSRTFAATYPVPPASSQPPSQPLQHRRSDAREYECGLAFCAPPGTSATRAHSLLPAHFPRAFEFGGADAAHASFADARFDNEEDPSTCVRLRVDVPLRHVLRDGEAGAEEAIEELRPTHAGPLRSVRHALELSLGVAYSGENEEEARTELTFTIPLSFVSLPRSFSPTPLPTVSATATASEVSDAAKAALLALARARAQTLPAYHTLFHRNGMPKEDPTPLPRYTPEGVLPDKDAEDNAFPRPAPRRAAAGEARKHTYVPAEAPAEGP